MTGSNGRRGRSHYIPPLKLATLVAAALLASATAAHAASTAEQLCEKERYIAAAKYSDCQGNVLAKVPFGSYFNAALSKCRVKYTDMWTNMQGQAWWPAPQGECTNSTRFEVLLAQGIVLDSLTGLWWERKTDDGTVHDKDNWYSWSEVPLGTAANGSAFTSFLRELNSGGCLAERCDWRLPTIAELQTIVLEPYPCTTHPCLDQTIFGPTASHFYWSATSTGSDPVFTWFLDFFSTGGVGYSGKVVGGAVRAVRGGL